MVLKHDFSLIFNSENPFWGLLLELNNTTSGLFGWAILLITFIVSSYVAIRQTQDTGKSFLVGGWITTLVAIILFYGSNITSDVVITYPLVSEVVLLFLLVTITIATAGTYFLRNRGA